MPDMTQQQYEECQSISLALDKLNDLIREKMVALEEIENACEEDSRADYLVDALRQLEEAENCISHATRNLDDIDEPE